MDTNELVLKVGEIPSSQQSDIGIGIVRFDLRKMHELGVREGEPVEVEGSRKTGAIAVRPYPDDTGLDIIRMDGYLRKNSGASIGERVIVRKADAHEAKKLVLAPTENIQLMPVPGEHVRPRLLGRVMVKGDVIVLLTRQVRMSRSNVEVPYDVLPFRFSETKFVVAGVEPKGIVKITDSTKVELLTKPVDVKDEAEIPSLTYEDIGGLREEVKKVREMIELPLKHPEVFERLGIAPPKGILLYGPPGTGKTLLARAVANETGANFIAIAGSEMTSKWFGESEKKIRDLFQQAEEHAPTIIFIDEVDALAPKREDVVGDVEKKMVAQLLASMDGLKDRGLVIVIAATNRIDSIDPALRRSGRFDREIEIGVPDKQGRKEILDIHTRHVPLAKDVNLGEIADRTHGYVGADLAGVLREAAMSALRRVLPEIDMKEETIPPEQLKNLEVTQEDLTNALRFVEPSAMREVSIEIPKATWSDVGGLEDTKQKLKEMVEWPLKYPEAFTRMGIRPPRGILLYGLPGTGKTLLAKAVANEGGLNFISVKGPEILSKWINESEKHIRDLFKRAKQVAPAIIFFDEIDAMAPKRDSSASDMVNKAVGQLLTELDGLEGLEGVVVIGTSVAGDTPVLLKLTDGTIKLAPISEFVDSCYAEEEEGVEKIVDGVQCLGFEKKVPRSKFESGLRFGNSAFKNIRGVFRHKVNEIYEIEYMGGKIRTTGNHSVFIRTKKGVAAKRVDELKGNEILADLPFKTRVKDNAKEIRAHNFDENFHRTLPVYENNVVLEDMYTFSLTSDLSQQQIALQTGFSQTTISNWKRNIFVPRAMSKNYFKHGGLPEQIEVTPGLMRLFGYYVAEGYARKELDFCFNEKETNLTDDVKNLMKKYFGIEPDMIRHITNNAVNVVYHTKPLASFFIRYFGKGAHKKHLPSFLFEAPYQYFVEFLKGYVAGDGHIDKDGKLSVTSVSKQLILELNWLCRMHGIKSYICEYTVEAGRKINGHVIKKDSHAYRLGIGKTNNPLLANKGAPSQKLAKIKSVKKVPYTGYVYDFCGCDNEAFFGGENPLLLHNTNRPDLLDAALLRPGRFDRHVLVPPPDKATRRKIFDVHMRAIPVSKAVKVETLLKKTEGYVGADIEAVCREAAIIALRENIDAKEVTEKHFAKALELVKPSVDVEAMKTFEKRVEKVKKLKAEVEEVRYLG